ncbi:alkaline phosphatase family protein [Natrinema altunense]|uniref:Type I phosphodiesterase/nucleotide pyrophosphatase n=1 Tax=Natrinema altunense (strain JCM 12890 / CGMCC 1.3731 / AJ2) TaxID=1227494 RepID=L9ZVI2_NATA2|nr:alkaline phosphatase family protein [Natrinema altunense]ELY89597.1 type I phosphodiesterase/nucleotide pyrophosphatase [Natrinema altunense JCM 12890]
MRTDLEARLRTRRTEDGYLFPDYGGYCFAGVPGTALSVLDADGPTVPGPLPADVLAGVDGEYDRVLVALVDGFGLTFWQRHDHPLLERLEAAGTVSPLTSIYPSETAAALTTFHTGRLPVSHGVLGWDVYDPVDDASYEAFTGRVTAGDESVDPDLADIFAGDPLYPALAAAGIDCRHVVPFPETYEGAAVHTYGGSDDDGSGDGGDAEGTDATPPSYPLEGFESALAGAFTAADEPAFLYAYLPQIDTAAHAAGTESDEYRATVEETLGTLERALSRIAANTADAAGETLVIVTADHGHVDTDAARSVDLESFETVLDSLERHATGEPVRYAGSPRNVHLHLQGGTAVRETVRSELADALEARVFTADEVREWSLFGDGEESAVFRRRVGDLVVCHRDQSVWYGSDSAKFELIGMHGGLHPDEQFVPFAAVGLEAFAD